MSFSSRRLPSSLSELSHWSNNLRSDQILMSSLLADASPEERKLLLKLDASLLVLTSFVSPSLRSPSSFADSFLLSFHSFGYFVSEYYFSSHETSLTPANPSFPFSPIQKTSTSRTSATRSCQE